jgi:large conductance mechanosensitive channel
MKKKNIKDMAVKEFGGFKEFISKGNVIDLAVGVIIGSAFGKIVTSVVNDILMPIIGAVIGGVNFTSLNIKIGDAVINYGSFIQNVFDFLVIALCVYIFVSIINKIVKKKEEPKKEVKKSDEVLLLEEIRDLLKKNK